jgi:hypothetical protein
MDIDGALAAAAAQHAQGVADAGAGDERHGRGFKSSLAANANGGGNGFSGPESGTIAQPMSGAT